MKKNLSTKDVFTLFVFIILIYALRSLIPLLLIAGVCFIIHKRKALKIENKPHRRLPMEDRTIDFEAERATLAECEEVINYDTQVRRETDLRQFQGRTDVTKEELATYMFEQRRWDGIYERRIQMEEIIKNCNLTEADIGWVEDELQHYHPYPVGTYMGDMNKSAQSHTWDNKVCYVRSDEEKAVWEYYNEKERTELKKHLRQLKIQQDTKDNFYPFPDKPQNVTNQKTIQYAMQDMRRCDYEAWLRLRGYST